MRKFPLAQSLLHKVGQFCPRWRLPLFSWKDGVSPVLYLLRRCGTLAVQLRYTVCASWCSPVFLVFETEANILDKVSPAHDVVHHEAIEEEPRRLSSATAGRG